MNHSPWSSSSIYPPERTTDCAPYSDCPAIPETMGKWMPHCLQSILSTQVLPTSTPWFLSGSYSAVMGPKWSWAVVTKILPLAALAFPGFLARSVVNALSGRSWFRMWWTTWGRYSPAMLHFDALAIRMAATRTELILRVDGIDWRQFAHVRFPCATHFS